MARGEDPYVALADEAAHRAAVAARRDERERVERATEIATWAGTLRDLAERRHAVAVTGSSGRCHRGNLVAVGADHIGIELGTGAVVAVALDTVLAVRPEPGGRKGPAMGDRDVATDRRLIDLLQEVAERDGAVAVTLRGSSDPLLGQVLGLGEDVLTLRLETAVGETAMIPLAAVAELLVEP